MKLNTFYKICLGLSLFLFISLAISFFSNIAEYNAPILIFSLLSLAIGVRAIPVIKGFSYSLMIIAAVSVSMYYPNYFLGIGTFKFKVLIIPLLQIIMFGMGSQMSLNDFKSVAKNPKGIVVGVICQFTIMPIVGVTIATLFNFPLEIAAGIVLVGSSPSGLASNVMSYIAKANLVLSVALTACATLLSPLLTPLLMKVFAGQFIEINFWQMMLGIFDMVILPICAGLIFNHFLNNARFDRNSLYQILLYASVILVKNIITLFSSDYIINSFISNFIYDLALFVILPILGSFSFRYFFKGNKELLEKALSFISMLGIGIIITIITAAGRESLLEVGLLLIFACFLHNILGYSIGYSFCRLLRMDKKDCRTIALEVGMQNGGLASGLALQMGKVATVGLAPAVFGPLMNITGSSLATWWRSKV